MIITNDHHLQSPISVPCQYRSSQHRCLFNAIHRPSAWSTITPLSFPFMIPRPRADAELTQRVVNALVDAEVARSAAGSPGLWLPKRTGVEGQSRYCALARPHFSCDFLTRLRREAIIIAESIIGCRLRLVSFSRSRRLG